MGNNKSTPKQKVPQFSSCVTMKEKIKRCTALLKENLGYIKDNHIYTSFIAYHVHAYPNSASTLPKYSIDSKIDVDILSELHSIILCDTDIKTITSQKLRRTIIKYYIGMEKEDEINGVGHLTTVKTNFVSNIYLEKIDYPIENLNLSDNAATPTINFADFEISEAQSILPSILDANTNYNTQKLANIESNTKKELIRTIKLLIDPEEHYKFLRTHSVLKSKRCALLIDEIMIKIKEHNKLFVDNFIVEIILDAIDNDRKTDFCQSLTCHKLKSGYYELRQRKIAR